MNDHVCCPLSPISIPPSPTLIRIVIMTTNNTAKLTTSQTPRSGRSSAKSVAVPLSDVIFSSDMTVPCTLKMAVFLFTVMESVAAVPRRPELSAALPSRRLRLTRQL